jgi:hypothetical protein
MAAALNSADTLQLNVPDLPRLRLDALCQGRRFQILDRLDQYASCRQYDRLRHNWDGYGIGYGGEQAVFPGYYVMLDKRRPNVRYNLGKVIIGRLTAMAMGEESWPEVTVPGDDEAEDYVKALATESRLQERMQEARNQGGGSGTACLSFSFVDGVPRVKAHEAKHMYPQRWVDKDEHVLGAVLKAYRYQRTVFLPDGKPVEKDFYFARYWDEQIETVWDPIPDELAKAGTWATGVRSYTVRHGYGECPVYWTQNLPDTEREDGISDIEGLEDNFDKINHLLSATTKGTIANVDPTLVIKDDATKNLGVVQKGSGQAIFAKGGAEYLELQGTSLKTGNDQADAIVRVCLNTAGVVIGDPDKMAAKAQSSLAMKMLYLPMCNQCDLLRVQYGALIVKVLRGMLRAARLITSIEPGPIQTTADGVRIQQRPVVVLPPKVQTQDKPRAAPGDPAESEEVVTDRVPGESDRLELKWPPYFQPTMPDVQAMVTAAVAAKGQTISQRTAVKFTAPVFGVTDVDQELAEIDVERATQVEEQGQLIDRQSEADARNGVPGGDGSAEE